jgi:hypothetical protein
MHTKYVGKHLGKEPLEGFSRTWHSIKMNLREKGHEDVGWIQLARYTIKWRTPYHAL